MLIPECLCKAFELLHCVELIINVALVCRTWLNILKQKNFYINNQIGSQYLESIQNTNKQLNISWQYIINSLININYYTKFLKLYINKDQNCLVWRIHNNRFNDTSLFLHYLKQVTFLM